MSLQQAVKEKLLQIENKIRWHKEQIELLKDNGKYWVNLIKDVEKLTEKKDVSYNV